MDGYSVDTQSSRVSSGLLDSIFAPRTPRTGNRGVILCHAANAPGEYLDATNTPSAVRLAAYLASHGIPCIAGQDDTNNLWGNDTAMAWITAAWAALISATGCASDKVCLYGVSMGAGTAARYAMLNPTKVAAVYGTAPMSSIIDFYVNNRTGTSQTAVGTAWGVTYPTALPAGADLVAQAPAASAIPYQMDYGTADTIVIPSTVTALATAWGSKATVTVVDTTSSHGDALFAKTDPESVRRLFIANGA